MLLEHYTTPDSSGPRGVLLYVCLQVWVCECVCASLKFLSAVSWLLKLHCLTVLSVLHVCVCVCTGVRAYKLSFKS